MSGEQDYNLANPGEHSFRPSTPPAPDGGVGTDMASQEVDRNGSNIRSGGSRGGGGAVSISLENMASFAEATAWMYEWYQRRWAAASSDVQQQTQQRQVRRRNQRRHQQQLQQQQQQQQQGQVVGVVPSTSFAEPTSVNVGQQHQAAGQQQQQVGSIGAALQTAPPPDVPQQQQNFFAQLDDDALLAWGFSALENRNIQLAGQQEQQLQHEGQEQAIFPSSEGLFSAWSSSSSATSHTSTNPISGQIQQDVNVETSIDRDEPQEAQQEVQRQVEETSFWAADSSSTNETADVNPIAATDHRQQQQLESLMRTWAQLSAQAAGNEQEQQELAEAFFAAWAGTGGSGTLDSILGGGRVEVQPQIQPAAEDAQEGQTFTAPEPANEQDTLTLVSQTRRQMQLERWRRDTQGRQQLIDSVTETNVEPQRAESEARPATITNHVNGEEHNARRRPTRYYIENPGLSFFNFSSSSSSESSSAALSASSSQSPHRQGGNNGRRSEDVLNNVNGIATVNGQNVQHFSPRPSYDQETRAQEERDNDGDVLMPSAPPTTTPAGLGIERSEHQPVLNNGGGHRLLGSGEEGEERRRGEGAIYTPPQPLVNGFHFPSRPGPSSAAETAADTDTSDGAVDPVRPQVNGIAPTSNINGNLDGSPPTGAAYTSGFRSNDGHEGQTNNEISEGANGGPANSPLDNNTSRTSNNRDFDSEDGFFGLLTFPTCWSCGATLPEVPPVLCNVCGVAN